jgi:DnaJ-class molecular chaperone
MENKGAYDEHTKQYHDIIFKFRYNISPPYSIDPYGNVTYTETISLEDLICGFEKKLKIYNEIVTIKSDHYFNPNNHIKVVGMGMQCIKTQKKTDLFIKLKVELGECDRLVKYNDVIRKIFKKTLQNTDTNITSEDPGRVININNYRA